MSDVRQISEDEYADLIEDRNWLRCLESAGVDNWEGYDFAQEIYAETYGDDA